MNVWNVGTTIELESTFVDENGQPYDPATVVGRVILPDETQVDLVVTRTDTGTYAAAFTPTQNGVHFYRFQGSTPPLSSDVEDSFMAQTYF